MIAQSGLCLTWSETWKTGFLATRLIFCYFFNQTIEEKPVKIDKWDPAALKNALDDAAKKVQFISAIVAPLYN